MEMKIDNKLILIAIAVAGIFTVMLIGVTQKTEGEKIGESISDIIDSAGDEARDMREEIKDEIDDRTDSR
jgi:low affinity Fe/Cu permease